MQGSLGELGDKMIKIKSDNECLEKGKAEMENKNSELEDNILRSTITIDELRNEINSLESSSKAKISFLEEELNIKSENLKSNISQIEDLEQTISKLKSDLSY